MHEFDDPYLRNTLQQLGGHTGDEAAAYAALQQRVRAVKRRRATIASGGLLAVCVAGLAVAGLRSGSTDSVSPAATGVTTAPTPEAAANVLNESKRVEGRGNSSFAFDVARDTTAAGTYPIVLVSYQIACSKYADQAQADLVKGFLTYTTSADGQQAAAQSAGSAPLPDSLASQIAPAVACITAGA